MKITFTSLFRSALGVIAVSALVSACSPQVSTDVHPKKNMNLPAQTNSKYKPKKNTDPTSVLPFYPDAKSFAYYLNNYGEWRDGKKRMFKDLGNCTSERDTGYEVSDRKEFAYSCAYGYVTVSDPIRGKIFCELSEIYDPDEEYAVVRYKADLDIQTFEWKRSGSIQFGGTGACKQL